MFVVHNVASLVNWAKAQRDMSHIPPRIFGLLAFAPIELNASRRSAQLEQTHA